jgi:hypothetical protein
MSSDLGREVSEERERYAHGIGSFSYQISNFFFQKIYLIILANMSWRNSDEKVCYLFGRFDVGRGCVGRFHKTCDGFAD